MVLHVADYDALRGVLADHDLSGIQSYFGMNIITGFSSTSLTFNDWNYRLTLRGFTDTLTVDHFDLIYDGKEIPEIAIATNEAEKFTGASGIHTITYEDSVAAVNINLATGTASGDREGAGFWRNSATPR